MVRVVNPEPGRVPNSTFLHEMMAEGELCSSLDGPAHGLASSLLGYLRKRGEPFPAVERAGSRRKAVPTAIGLLSSHNPPDRALNDRVVEVAEADQGPDGVSGDADLPTSTREVPSPLAPSVPDHLRGPSDSRIGPGHAKI